MTPVIMPGIKALRNLTFVLGIKMNRPVIIKPDKAYGASLIQICTNELMRKYSANR